MAGLSRNGSIESSISGELERTVARQIIYAILWDANLPVMIVGEELETGILLMLSGQESRARH